MSEVSPTVTEFWQARFLSGEFVYRDDELIVTVNSELPEERRVMLLETATGQLLATVTPAIADRLDLRQLPDLPASGFRGMLRDTGVALHGADYLFYFSEAGKDALLHHAPQDHLCRLSEVDRAAFATFQSSASEEDLDAAYVELDHWAVFGAFDENRLVCAASMYPWEDSRLADLGILTLPDFRGQGHARRVVRAICAYSVEQGYEPQYRCQLDNLASKRLAEVSGLTLFGTWDVVSPDSTV